MCIPKLRTVTEVVQYVREIDPETAVTENMIRTLIKKKRIIARRIGNKVIVNLDECVIALTDC